MPRLSASARLRKESARSARASQLSPTPPPDPSADEVAGPSRPADPEQDYFDSVREDFDGEPEVQVLTGLQVRQQLIEENKQQQNVIEEVGDTVPNRSILDDSDILSAFADHPSPCPQCQRRLVVSIEKQYSNTTLIVKCRRCDYEKRYARKTLPEGELFSDINMHLVYESFEDGRGYIGYKKVCAAIGVESITKHSYYKIREHIGNICFQLYRQKTDVVYDCLVAHYATLGRVPDDNGILDIDVSFDGSWLTRGYSSHVGVGAVIDAHTGFVIDFHVVCNYCVGCNRLRTKKDKKKISEQQFNIDMDAHRNGATCNRNFETEPSSGAMEAEEARVLWGRSLDFKYRYINFIGDGDSSAYNKVVSMNNNMGPYENVEIVKEECVNHVGKRFGTRLREAKN